MGRRWTTDRQCGGLAIAVIAVIGQIGLSAPASAAPDEGVPAQIQVQPALPPAVAPPLPELDQAFYEPPVEVVESREPGEIIAARAVNLGTLNLIPTNVDAWQISYRSNNAAGEAIPAVTTVIKPRGDTRDGGPRPLLSFQMAEDSLGNYCAPSYVMQQGALPWLVTGAATGGAQFLEVQAALAQGWALSVPDHQGPNSSFASGPVAARITLDGIRAAENFEPMELQGRSTRVGLLGYSGGSIPTGHAAEIRQAYAPELNIVGVAEGGVAADLGALLDNANNALGAGIVAAGVIGVSREDPELAGFIDQHINPAGRALFAAKDWLVPVGPVNKLVDTYCQDPSASVVYTRDHFSEHVSMEVVALPSALLWLRDRFAGVPAQQGCSTFDAGSMALDQRTWPVWVDAVGELVAGLFGKPIGT